MAAALRASASVARRHQAYAMVLAHSYLEGTLPFLKDLLCKDKVATVELVKDRAAQAAAANDLRTLYSCKRQLAGWVPRPVPAVLLEDGTHAASPEEARKMWQRYFLKDIFKGAEVVDVNNIAASTRSRQSQRWWQGPIDMAVLDPAFLPALEGIQTFAKKRKPSKSHGGDGIPGEIIMYSKGIFAHILWPLFLKSTARLEEPPKNKGGSVFELFMARVPTPFARTAGGSSLVTTPRRPSTSPPGACSRPTPSSTPRAPSSARSRAGVQTWRCSTCGSWPSGLGSNCSP